MNTVFLLFPVAVTSAAAYLLGRRLFRLPRAGVALGVRRMLECLGISAVFLWLDVSIGSVIVIAVRTLTPHFVSVYVMADEILVPLALFQGLTFWWWFRAPRQT